MLIQRSMNRIRWVRARGKRENVAHSSGMYAWLGPLCHGPKLSGFLVYLCLICILWTDDDDCALARERGRLLNVVGKLSIRSRDVYSLNKCTLTLDWMDGFEPNNWNTLVHFQSQPLQKHKVSLFLVSFWVIPVDQVLHVNWTPFPILGPDCCIGNRTKRDPFLEWGETSPINSIWTLIPSNTSLKWWINQNPKLNWTYLHTLS